MEFSKIGGYGSGLFLVSQLALAGCSSLPPVKEHPAPENVPQGSYVVKTLHRTYYKLDQNRNTPSYIKDGKKFYEVEQAEIIEHRVLNPEKTMLIVMDPWEDVGSDLLNNHCGKVFHGKMLPLVNKCIELGIPVTVLTNAKDAQGYGYDIYRELAELGDQGKLEVVFHGQVDAAGFTKKLKSRGIDTLVYCGFCTNMCLIGRPLGMIGMNLVPGGGFRLFFVPDSSGAIEFGPTWESQEIHNWVSFALSQWLVELIYTDDILKLVSN